MEVGFGSVWLAYLQTRYSIPLLNLGELHK